MKRQSMSTRVRSAGGWAVAACVSALALGNPARAQAGTWTNAAGQAIEADLVALDGRMATFERPDGERLTMPLASLSAASRQQALGEWSRIEIPERLQSDYRLCAHTVVRLDALRQAGRILPDEHGRQRDAALARLKAACARLDVPEALGERIVMLARNQ